MKNSKQKIRTRALAVLLALLMVIGSHPMQNYSALAATTEHQDVYTITVKTGEAGSETPVKDAKVTVNILDANGIDTLETLEQTTGEDGVAVFQRITELLPDDTAAPVSFTYTVEGLGYQKIEFQGPVEVNYDGRLGDMPVTLVEQAPTPGEKQEQTDFELLDKAGNPAGASLTIIHEDSSGYFFSTNGALSSKAVSFTLEDANGAAAIDETTGALTVNRPGNFTVTATSPEDDTYKEAVVKCYVTVKKDASKDMFTFSVAGEVTEDNPDTPDEIEKTIKALENATVTITEAGTEAEVEEITTNGDGVAVLKEVTERVKTADPSAVPISFNYNITAQGYKPAKGTITVSADGTEPDTFAVTGNKDVVLEEKEEDTNFKLDIPKRGGIGEETIGADSATIEVGNTLTFTTSKSERTNSVVYEIMPESQGFVEDVTETGQDAPENTFKIKALKPGQVTIKATIEEDEYRVSEKEYTVTIEMGQQSDFHFTDANGQKIDSPLLLTYKTGFTYTISTGGGCQDGTVTYTLKESVKGVTIDKATGEIHVKRPCDFTVIAQNAGKAGEYDSKEIECHVVVKNSGQEKSLTMTVGDENGKAINDANVTVKVTAPASQTELTGKTSGGSVSFPNLTTLLEKNDSITISYKITAAGYNDIAKNDITLSREDCTGNIDEIMTKRNMVTVTGNVSGDDGNAIVGAVIQVSGYDILPKEKPISDTDGNYTVELYEDISYTFKVTGVQNYKNYEKKGLTFNTTQSTHKIVMEKKETDRSFKFAKGKGPFTITYKDDEKFFNVASGSADNNGEITYKVTAGANVVSVDEKSGEVTLLEAGDATITAYLKESGKYLSNEISYNLHVDLAANDSFRFLSDSHTVVYDADQNQIEIVGLDRGKGKGKISFAVLAKAGETDGNPTDIAELVKVNGKDKIQIKKAGTVAIQATKAADGQYREAIKFYTLTIDKASQQLKFTDPDRQITFDANNTRYTNVLSGAMGTGPLTYEITASENGGQPCAKLLDEETGEIELLGYGTVIVTAIKAGDECYKGGSLQYTLTIERAAQGALKFAQSTPDKVTFNRNNNTYNLTTTGGTGTGAITYEVISGTESAAVDRETGELSIKKPGTFTVRATKAQDNQYNAIWTEHTITVDKDTQAIAFETPRPGNLIYGNAFSNPVKEVPDTSDLNGKGYGTGVITYSIVSGEELASVDSMGKLTFADATVGTVVVKAEKAGDEYYYPTEQTYTLRVDYLTPPQVPYTIAGSTLNASGWYTGNATIAAPEGYQISESNKLTGNLWSDTLIVTQEGGNPKTVYLKNDQGITDAIDITQDKLLIDKTNPEGLSIRYSTSVLSTVIEALTFGFYRAPVTVTLEAADTTSGIDSFTYSYELQTGASTVNEGAVNVVVGRERMAFDGNTASYSFEIPPQFRGQVSFTAADVSGRETSFADNQILVTDAISPTADITYNDPVQTAGGVSYYDGTIQAAISVTEANFYSEDVTVTISKDGGAPYAVQPDWTTGGGDVHTGTFDIQEDGDYIVTVEYQDRSGNEMNVYTSEQLTVDMTQPVISVEGIQHASANREEKIGFIVTVEDTNLDREAFVPLLMATLRNQDGKFETVDLSEKGSVQTVTEGSQYQYVVENLDADAIYTLTCSARDFAGNEITDMVAQGSGEPLPQMRFSVNREGSTYDIDEATRQINGTFVKEPVDIAIYEINADPLSNLKITLFKNDRTIELVENTDYQVRDLSGEGQWYQYEYRIPKALFMDDGVYRIVTHTQDAAGNVAENTLDTKNTEIGFGVDKTNPNLIFTNLEDETTYPVENMEVVMDISDNLKLESVVAYLDDEECRSWSSEEILLMTQEQDDFSFGIPGDSIRAHSVRVVSTDAAGNAAVSQVQNFYVTTNRWVQFYNNKPLFFGAIAGVVVMLGGAVAVVILVSRRRQNANTNFN